MKILGINGSVSSAYSSKAQIRDVETEELLSGFHDSAAVLLIDGKIVAAVEEERLNRIKHSTHFPSNAILSCLKMGGISSEDLDYVAYYTSEEFSNFLFNIHRLLNASASLALNIRDVLSRQYKRDVDQRIKPSQFVFVDHHHAHAESAYLMANGKDSLIVTLDGSGEGVSGTVYEARDGKLIKHSKWMTDFSIGNFYLQCIYLLGYGLHDEYKVMGLAPYGDAGRFRHLFKEIYTLLEDGEYCINWKKIGLEGELEIFPPRRKGGEFTQEHKDFSAALQEATEEMVFHRLRHFQKTTGLKRLCLAGGVAHNCTLNGKIAYSKIFDEVYVQPASHDAGCALGSALSVHRKHSKEKIIISPKHIYAGEVIQEKKEIGCILSKWKKFVAYRESSQIEEDTADLLAQGKVVGWVQGRSEFGPRALGNRSILADPRPGENKRIINAMIKKREGYRPFAPSVKEERASDFFDIPPGIDSSYMTYVVDVRKEFQSVLQAITHVNGTARLQTVAKETNAIFWNLLDAFERRSGIPMLLNTSFNNNVEPIVDSVEDAITCFLTTDLHYLVVGDYIIEKKAGFRDVILENGLNIPRHSTLEKKIHIDSNKNKNCRYYIQSVTGKKNLKRIEVSKAFYEVIVAEGEAQSAMEICTQKQLDEGTITSLKEEVFKLWCLREVLIKPLVIKGKEDWQSCLQEVSVPG